MKKSLTLLGASLFVLSCTAPAQSHDIAPPAEVLSIYDIAEAPSADRIYADIEKLAGFGTRHTLSVTESNTRGIGAARRWIFDEFEKISADCGVCLEVIYVSDVVEGERRIPEPTDVVSVLAIQKGTIDPNRYVVMSGDIDSRVTDPLNGTDDSPGANDNASGMAGTIEAARILSKQEFAGSIIYAALSGEEQGLFGGKIVAAHALQQGWEIKGVLNNDMISNITGVDGVTDNSTVRVFSEGTRAIETPEEARLRRFTGGEVDSPSRNLARYVKSMADQYMTNLDVMMVYRLDRYRRGGHHRPFNDVGMPGVRIMETHEHYDRQHQDLRTGFSLKFEYKANFEEMGVLKENVEASVHHSMVQSLDPRPPSDDVYAREKLRHLEDALSGSILNSEGDFVKITDIVDVIPVERTMGDTMEGVDKHYAAKLTALNAITLAGMAGAPPFPVNVEASGAVTASANLTWETPENADNLAGYKVHWRLTTAPEWTHSRYIGKVNKWAFKNLVIDNYYFGVSAVSHDGYETPVVFPGPAGRF